MTHEPTPVEFSDAFMRKFAMDIRNVSFRGKRLPDLSKDELLEVFRETWTELLRLQALIQPQQMPTREEMAGIVYEGAHKSLKNCWKWTDDGLDAEHPGRRGYYYKIADAVLAALSHTRPELSPTEKIEDGQS